MDRIIAAEVTGNGAEIFVRETAGNISRQLLPFTPWLLAEKGVALPEGAAAVELSGGAELDRRIEFASLEAYENALPELKKTPGVMTIRDLSCQFFSLSGLRLFSGMDFNELHRMQFAVIPSADEKSVECIEVEDNRGYAAKFDITTCGSEADVLAAFDRAIIDRDPDLLEGFNIFRNDLPLLEKRAKKLKFSFSCGRDGGTFVSRKSRFSVAEKQISCTRYTIYGRHIIDTYHLLLFYDAVHRDFESFELDYLKDYFHIGGDVSVCGAVRMLSDLLLPASFYKCCTLPLNLQDAVLRGSGAALKSRALEGFQRRFIQAVLQSKLTGQPDILENCYTELKNSIENRTIDLSELVKSEVLSDSPENYKRKQGAPGFRRSAPYELALASGKKFCAGDKVGFYVTGNKAKVAVVENSKLFSDADPAVRDENSAYYLNKLDELYKQFK